MTASTPSTHTSQQLTVQVPSLTRSYEIHIGAEALSMLPSWLSSQSPQPKKIAVISDTHVGPLYAVDLVEKLQTAGLDVSHYDLPSGELAKSLKSAQTIYEILIDARFSRHDFLVVVGGGVVGDLVGFCASSYQRGMRWVQVPTTLLAQVDSSVGGKVAINFGGLKNVIGSFYQPNLVIADLNLIATLPDRDYRAGLGEIVKYALLEKTALGDLSGAGSVLPEASLLAYLSAHVEEINHKDAHTLTEIVHRCCAMKAAVVAADETDTTGHRAILNLGHTFAHAYESASDYAILHGEAVAMGLKNACELSVKLDLLPYEAVTDVFDLMQRLHLHTEPPEKYPAANLIDWMRQDKKNQDGKITLVLPVGEIGKVEVRRDIDESDILKVLQ